MNYQMHRRKAFQQKDLYWNNVSLLLPMTGTNGSTTFTDYSPAPKTITANGNAQISTAQSVFGGGSALFDGSTDYLTIPVSSNFYFPGDFTWEVWVRLAGYSLSYSGAYGAAIISNYNGAGPAGNKGWQIRINGTASSYTTINVYTGITDLNFSHSFSLNTWYYLAIKRISGVLSAWVDGVEVGSVANTDNLTEGPSVNRPLYLGGLNDTIYLFWLDGYLGDLRLTKGVARDVSVVPTAPFPIG